MSAQVDLPLEHESQPVDFEYLTRSKKTVGSVVTYSAELAELDPKQCYIPLRMQKSVWSGICSDQRSFPMKGEGKEYQQFRGMTGNDALLFWLAHISGYDPRSLRRYRTAVEIENERLREALEAERQKNAVITEFMREVKG